MQRPVVEWLCAVWLSQLNLACHDEWRANSPDSSFPTEVDATEPRGTVIQYRFESSHQGVALSASRLERRPLLVWSQGPLGIGDYGASKSSPAIAEDSVYVGQDDGRLWALKRNSGEPLWSFATRRHFEELGRPDRAYTGIHGSPAFDEKNVYIGDYAGWLYAVDRRSGELVWERQLGGSIGSSPVLDGERIWIAVEFPNPDGKVFAVRASDGALLLVSEYLGDQIHGTVSLSQPSARLVIGTNQGQVLGLLPESLAVAWTQWLDGAVKSTAAIVGDMALVTAWDGALHAFDLSSGQPRFSVSTQGRSMSSPAAWDDLACFGSHDYSLPCVELATGLVRWKAFTGGIVSSSPIIVKDSRLVIVGSVDGSIYAYWLDSGALAWTWFLGTAITSVPVAVERSLFVNDDLGTVWRLDASDGP